MNQTSRLAPFTEIHSSNLSNLSISINAFDLMTTTQRKRGKSAYSTHAIQFINEDRCPPNCTKFSMTLASLLVTKIQYFSWKITYGLGVAASARQKSYIKMRLGDYPYYFASHNVNIMPTYCVNVIGCRGFCEQDLQLRHQRPMKSGSNLSSQAG